MKIKTLLAATFGAIVVVHANIVNLNGNWEFRFEREKSLEDVCDAQFKANASMCVPGCFDMLPDYLMQRGTGLYRRTFDLAQDVVDARLVVDGMGLRGRFLLDGRDLGLVAMPYSRFELATGPLKAGRHTLVAALDNNFGRDKMKMFLPYYDFYAHGGFYHGVSLKLQTAPVQLDRVYVRTRDYKTGQVELELAFLGKVPADFTARVRFDTETAAREVAFKDARATMAVPAFKLWSPKAPNLHTVCVAAFDTKVEERFGIREIKAADKRLWLNGEMLYLKGANRHESHPQFGSATPEALMLEDIQNVKSLGGNFIRGAHYPQSQRFLDYCDEMGVLVWEESLGWGNHKIDFVDPEFGRLQVEQTRLMVRTSFNHPCVIIYGFLNEGASENPAAKPLYNKLIDTIRAEDSGRLVTYACNRVTNDICNDNTDLIAFNTYPGWIGTNAGSPENLKRLIRENVEGIVARFRKLYPDRPIIVSEMGTCAIYGFHDRAAGQHSEEFEAEYDGDVIDVVFANPEICGLALWQLTDARTYHRGGAGIREKPMAINLAGLYDAYRRPKAVVEVVRAGFARTAAGERPAK